MSKRQFIKYTVTSATMGDATDEDANKYAAALQAKLEATYPEHDIEVIVNNRISSSQCDSSDDLGDYEVERVAQNLWDSGDWWTA